MHVAEIRSSPIFLLLSGTILLDIVDNLLEVSTTSPHKSVHTRKPVTVEKTKGMFYKLVNYILFKGFLLDFVLLIY